jgi:rRNA maturation endonuclease Nob1
MTADDSLYESKNEIEEWEWRCSQCQKINDVQERICACGHRWHHGE